MVNQCQNMNGCHRLATSTGKFCGMCSTYFYYSKKLGLWGYVKFTDQIEQVGECWHWTGVLTRGGYGLYRNATGQIETAHRASYEHYRAWIPAGLNLDHLCRNTRCVNPDHLEPVTQTENMRRRNLEVANA